MVYARDGYLMFASHASVQQMQVQPLSYPTRLHYRYIDSFSSTRLDSAYAV